MLAERCLATEFDCGLHGFIALQSFVVTCATPCVYLQQADALRELSAPSQVHCGCYKSFEGAYR